MLSKKDHNIAHGACSWFDMLRWAPSFYRCFAPHRSVRKNSERVYGVAKSEVVVGECCVHLFLRQHRKSNLGRVPQGTVYVIFLQQPRGLASFAIRLASSFSCISLSYLTGQNARDSLKPAANTREIFSLILRLSRLFFSRLEKEMILRYVCYVGM